MTELTGVSGTDPNMKATSSTGTGTFDYTELYSGLLAKYNALEAKYKEIVSAYGAALTQMDGIGFAILSFARTNKIELDKQQ